MSQVSQEVPFLVSSPTNILTIQDVVLDSPVWRANVLHLEDQIDQFEKWIDGFIRALKNYIDAIIKHNTQASTLCKRTFFNGLDGTLIDPKIAGNVVTKFATTLQSTIAYRMKMASDLEDLLLNPLQKVIKNDLKSFKDSRKQFDKILDKYETQLNRYNVLSKQKEPSALREDAFQMYELRKLYVKNSGDYFEKLVAFKATLENILVECFSGALGAHIEEIDESAYSCETAKSKLPGWRQWLDESKVTCDYQVQKIKKRCTELQDMYIEQTKPHRSLKRYSTQSNDQMSAVSPSRVESDEEAHSSTTLLLDPNTIGVIKKPSSPSLSPTSTKKAGKQGYLNSRIVITGKSSRPPWARKWFFLQEGWFGTCTVTTVNKEKGCIILGDRVAISECVFRVCTDIDRRYCFEVIHPKCSYYLQAETEEEMQQWLWAIEYSMEKHDQKPLPTSPQALLSPMSNNKSNSKLNLSLPQESPRLVAMSTSPLPSPDGTLTPTTTSSLTALLIREGSNTTELPTTIMHQDSNSISHQLSSWGMPWLTTGINTLSTSSEEDLLKSSSSSMMGGNGNQQLIVWPTKLEMDVPKPELSHYSANLEASQRELRKLFANVPEDEIVIESFLASLYRKPHVDEDLAVDKSVSYGYSGSAYVTQKRLWFYSCTLMTCVNMIVVPLEKIKSIRLESTEYSNSMLMLIEVSSSTDQTFCFGLWLESAELISERLKVIVENFRTMDVQTLYDTIRNMTVTKLNRNSKIPTNHVTTSSALYASVTPLTVQAQQQPMQQTRSTSTTGTVDDEHHDEGTGDEKEIPPASTTPPSSMHRGSPAQGALTAVYNNSIKKKKNLAVLKGTSSASTPIPSDQEIPSSSSEEQQEWPTHITKPKGEVNCDCTEHLDKKEADLVLPVNAKQLYQIMFSDEQSGYVAARNSIWYKLNKAKNYGEPTLTEWSKSKSEGVLLERTMSYIMPVTAPMVKAKETDVIETMQVLKQKEYISYVVMVMTKTPNLPYADAFIPCIKYCITYVSPTTCRLVCSIGVKWLKSIFVKGMVNKAATKGMMETVSELLPIVRHELSRETINIDTHQLEKKPLKRDESLPEIPKDDKAKSRNKKQSAWYPQNLFSLACVLICALSIIYQAYNSKKYVSLLHDPHHNGTTSMIWRGVYLRDIENEVTGKEAVLDHVNENIYQLFQDSRVEEGTAQQWKYHWFSKQHRSIAVDLGYSRERLGTIRYELLSTFRILNRFEYELLETEYWNWLSDKKLQCRRNKNKNELCEAIEKEEIA